MWEGRRGPRLGSRGGSEHSEVLLHLAPNIRMDHSGVRGHPAFMGSVPTPRSISLLGVTTVKGPTLPSKWRAPGPQLRRHWTGCGVRVPTASSPSEPGSYSLCMTPSFQFAPVSSEYPKALRSLRREHTNTCFSTIF